LFLQFKSFLLDRFIERQSKVASQPIGDRRRGY
jgi:hypothetical protein